MAHSVERFDAAEHAAGLDIDVISVSDTPGEAGVIGLRSRRATTDPQR